MRYKESSGVSTTLLFSPVAIANKTHIFIVQKEAVEERHLLHCDCSVNNGMIEDRPDGPSGSLIN